MVKFFAYNTNILIMTFSFITFLDFWVSSFSNELNNNDIGKMLIEIFLNLIIN